MCVCVGGVIHQEMYVPRAMGTEKGCFILPGGQKTPQNRQPLSSVGFNKWRWENIVQEKETV